MNEVHVNIETDVNPTEDIEKIKLALKNLFVFSSIVVANNKIFVNLNSDGREGFERFRSILKQERILNAARRVLIKELSGNSTVFYLNKQAAYMKRISFCEPICESVLGSIKVRIESNEIKAFIDWLTLVSS